MNLDQMEFRCPDAEIIGNVVVKDYRLVFRGNSRGNGVASILPEQGEQVSGVLWSITEKCEKSLDYYEGYPYLYGKQDILVQCEDGQELYAAVYIMNEPYQSQPALPGKLYLEGILEGCRQNGLSENEIQKAVHTTRKEMKKQEKKKSLMVGKWDDKDKGERMIMKGKWKTRAMAFVMAFSMGMSSMISSSVYAAAEQPETKVETETQVFEEQTEEKVRAEDIVKDVSDKEFRVETSMEGISYDPERESVLLSEIKDQDGGSFQPENPGVYYAQYLVTPKDGSEPYMIGRTITLTDTEGLAHSESNGGEKQKEDTSSEEESEQPLPVEITSSQPEDTPDVLAELERDIEEGNVMMFSAADGMGKSETVHLNKGRTIYYPDYLGNYLTCLFTVNGKLAYCLESHRASPPTGDYVADILESNKNLQKVLYYGYGGAGDITGSYLSGKSDDEKYVYTHLAASYAYCGDLAFTGCPYENLVNAGVIAYINHLFGMEEPPKGELSFSNANVTAVREGDIQKTPDITLNGDHRNKITIPVPQGVTGYNKSKGTNVSGGNLEVYGGDTFYLQAPLTVTGKWESGQLYGSVRESWKTLVLTSTGGNNQDIGAFISEKAAPVSFGIQWLNLARVKILKRMRRQVTPWMVQFMAFIKIVPVRTSC